MTGDRWPSVPSGARQCPVWQGRPRDNKEGSIAELQFPGTDTVRDVLVDYARQHAGTLRFVDRYAREHASQDPGPVAPADIVMLNVFAARPSPDLTVELLTTSDHYGWDPARDHAPASLTEGPEDPIAWARTEGVDGLRELYVDVVEGVDPRTGGRRGRSRRATASKLLYVRWPDTVPVVDSRLDTAYASRADALRDEIPSRIVRYWAAIRQDLMAAADALVAAADQAATILEGQADGESSQSAVARDLRHLSALRLLDIVVWAG